MDGLRLISSPQPPDLKAISAPFVKLNLIVCFLIDEAGKLYPFRKIMLSTSQFDIGSFLVHDNDPAAPTLNKPLPKAPLRAQHRQNLASSAESFLETDIPSPSLYHDPDIDRWMSPTGSSRQSRLEVVSYASTFRASSPAFCVGTDRDSFGSTYEEFFDDLMIDQEYMHHSHQEPKNHTLRPASVLPASQLEYRPCSDQSSTLYSAPLHPSSWSANQSTLRCSSNLNTSSSSSHLSFPKRSLGLLEVENLCAELDSEIFDYETSRRSSEARPSTPTSSLLPSLSCSSSTDSSPSSIMTYTSSQDIAQNYGAVEYAELPKGRKPKAPPMRLALGDTQSRINARARNISSPIPSPKFQDVNSAAAASFYRTPSSRSFAPTPYRAPTLTVEISKFEDSDDEEGKFSHHVKKIKSAVSLQNLHGKSRARAESTSRTPPLMPSALAMNTDYLDDEIAQLNCIGGVKLRNSKESNKSNSSTIAAPTPTSAPVFHITSNGTADTSYYSTVAEHNGASPASKVVSPAASLQQKTPVRRERSNTISSASSVPTPPPNTPMMHTPRSTSIVDRRQSRISWYSCFSHAPSTEDTIGVTVQRNPSNSKASKKDVKVSSSPCKVRVFFKRLFRFKK